MATTPELAILALMNLPKVASQTVYKVADRLASSGSSLDYLLEYDTDGLVKEDILPEPLAVALTSDAQRRWRDSVARALETQNIELIAFTSERYPTHLRQLARALAPPMLMVAGNAELLQQPGIAFAGARNVSPGGATTSGLLAREAVRKRFTVVSGGAKGTDTHAHDEAVRSGGSTIKVLAQGILTTSSRSLIQESSGESVAIISTFLPHGAWQPWRAMARNNHILGLSDRLVVIEAGESGGTVAVGKLALKHGIDTWVLDHAIPPPSAAGNRMLLDLGAKPIPVDEFYELALPDELFALHHWNVEPIAPPN